MLKEAHTSCKSLSEDIVRLGNGAVVERRAVDSPAWLAHVCCFPFCCRDVQYWNWNDSEYISAHSYHDHDVGDVWVDVPPKTKKAARPRENQLRGSEDNKWKQPILLPRQAASSTEATEAAEAAASPSSSPSWGFVSNLHHTYTNYHRQNMTKCQGATPPTISKHLSTPNTQPFCFWGFSWSFKSLNGRHFLTLPGSQCHLRIVVRGQDVGHCCGHPSSRTIGRLVALLINRGRPFVAHLQSSGGFSQQDENVLHKWHQKPWLKCYNDVVGISSLDLQYESIWYMIYHDVSNLNLMYDMNLL